jgi:glutathione S-transferase
MPALRDGDYTLADSSAIVQYLDAKFSEPSLIPANPELRGRTIWFNEFADTILVACGVKISFNRIVEPRFSGRPCNEEEVQQAELNDLPPILHYLESVLPFDDGYLVGDSLRLADIAVAGPFANFRHTNTQVDPSHYPHTLAYADRILSRPSFAQWVERDGVFGKECRVKKKAPRSKGERARR